MNKLILAAVLAAGVWPTSWLRGEMPFAKGADVGWLSQMESEGTKFYNAKGVQQDCLQILKDEGLNAIRLRVWVNPKNGWCGKDDVGKMAQRASALGLRVMIDFHYSDTWADPGQQKKPAAWMSHDFAQLKKDVYDHTHEVLTALKAAGVTPEWVQIGNEISPGMLWPDGRAKNRRQLVELIDQGYDAVKAVDKNILVIIHLNNGADRGLFRHWFDAGAKFGLKYDVIGVSFYPEKQDWQPQSDRCLANLKDLAARYQKPVIISEIGFFASEPEITRELVSKMIKGCEAVPNGQGLGLFYWEPEGYTRKYNRTAWGQDGRPTSAMEAFKTN